MRKCVDQFEASNDKQWWWPKELERRAALFVWIYTAKHISNLSVSTPRKKKVMPAPSSHTVGVEYHFDKWQLLYVNVVIQLKKSFQWDQNYTEN